MLVGRKNWDLYYIFVSMFVLDFGIAFGSHIASIPASMKKVFEKKAAWLMIIYTRYL